MKTNYTMNNRVSLAIAMIFLCVTFLSCNSKKSKSNHKKSVAIKNGNNRPKAIGKNPKIKKSATKTTPVIKTASVNNSNSWLGDKTYEQYIKGVKLINIPVKDLMGGIKNLITDAWYGLYMVGNKLGYFHTNWTLINENGKSFFINKQSIHIELINLQGKKVINTTITYRFKAWGKGELVSQVVVQKTPRENSTFTLTLENNGKYKLVVWKKLASEVAGHTSPGKIIEGTPGGIGESELAIMYLISQGKKQWNGVKEWKTRKFIHTPGFVSNEVLSVIKEKQTIVSGIKTKLYKVRIFSDKPRSKFDAFIDTKGVTVDGNIGSFTVKREDKKTAVNIKAKRDLGIMIRILANIKNYDPKSTNKLILNIKGIFPESVKFLNNSRYNLLKKSSNNYVLTLTKDNLKNLKSSKVPAKITKYLESTNEIEASNKDINSMANKVVKGLKTNIQKVKALTMFVGKYVEDTMWYDFDSALHILKVKKGDCTEHSLLLTALLRSIKIPSRRVGGVGYVRFQDGKWAFGYHMWVQVWLGRWIDVDPTWEQFPADASHIMLGDPLNGEWFSSIGNIKITSSKAL
jgi:Transglutaminase-like superfamily